MPRGRGQVGKAYANRTDMQGANVVSAQPVNTAKKLPVATATGQPYGAATIQKNSQEAVAMGGTQTPPPPTTAQTPAQPPQAPLTPLNAATDHGLSMFHGMDNVAGGSGSDALVQTTPLDPASQALTLLNTLGDNVSAQVAYIRNYLALQPTNQMPQ